MFRRSVLLVLSMALIFAARFEYRAVFDKNGAIYFTDADCYSRMTRVQAVMERPGTILRHHDFENWPDGTTPHTTAPLDYLIAAGAVILQPFAGESSRDLAGALVPPLLALASGMVLWKFASQWRFPTQAATLMLFAVSPILVHGTSLGRPDHQALLIFLVTLALAADGWNGQFYPVTSGIAWGLAFWTSLFEPVVLWLVMTLAAVFSGKFTKERLMSIGATAGIFLLSLGVEHWRIGTLPDAELFRRWSLSIGELARPGWFSGIFLRWTGLVCLAVPIVLGWRLLRNKESACLPWLAVALVTWGLSAWMVRWGYFFALAIVLALPWVLETWRGRWPVVLFFAVSLWPIAREWDSRLFPDSETLERSAEQREDYRQLREVASVIREAGDVGKSGVIAPWWLSPPLTYWSGAPSVAGSSHQSLPGIVDTAEFYLERFPDRAWEIAQRRRVRWVIAYEPSRVLSTSGALLNRLPMPDAMDVVLYRTPEHAPPWLQLRFESTFFKLYEFSSQ
ncbi:MAG TPA: hypothetical protein VIT21_08640 [Chthoniobacterales bacterium]